MSSRRRPLHTCGVSAFAITCRACRISQDLNGPVGSMTKKMVKTAALVSPLVQAIQYLLLAVLSFADDRILAVENIIEKCFPPSRRMFNRIDEAVQFTEDLPRKFDYAVKRFPAVICQIPYVEYALLHVISLLNFLTATFTEFRSKSLREKEIVVDVNSDNHNWDCTFSTDDDGDFPPLLTTRTAETETVPRKGSYKEVLKKGTKEDKKKIKTRKGVAGRKDESIFGDEQILELFDSAWLTTSDRLVKKRSIHRSGSYS